MPALLESLLLLASLAASYTWVSSPELRPYSLQLTAILLGIFFVSKRLSRSGVHHVLPTPESLETAFLVGAVSLVVGSTGALDSPFLPLFHLILFFGVLSLRTTGNLALVTALTVFLWATSGQPFSREDWIELLSLPFLLPLLIFARMQFDESRDRAHLLESEDEALREEEARIARFVRAYLRPKLRQVRNLLDTSAANAPAAAKQLALVEDEAEQILGRGQISLLEEDRGRE